MNATSVLSSPGLSDVSLKTTNKQTDMSKEQQLLKWTASLPAQSEDKQIAQLELADRRSEAEGLRRSR